MSHEMQSGEQPTFGHLVMHLAKYAGMLANAAEKLDHAEEAAQGRLLAVEFYDKYLGGKGGEDKVTKTIDMLKEQVQRYIWKEADLR